MNAVQIFFFFFFWTIWKNFLSGCCIILQYVFPKIKSILLNNYYIIPQIRKITLMKYFYLISDFIQISVIFIMLLIAKEKPKSGIECSYHDPLDFFNWKSSWDMLYLVDHLSVYVFLIFPYVWVQVTQFSQNITEAMWNSQCITAETHSWWW